MLICATLIFLVYVCMLTDQLPFRPVKSLFPYFPLRLTQFICIRISYNNYFYYLFIYFYLLVYLFIYLMGVCACVCESLLIIQCQF